MIDAELSSPSNATAVPEHRNTIGLPTNARLGSLTLPQCHLFTTLLLTATNNHLRVLVMSGSLKIGISDIVLMNIFIRPALDAELVDSNLDVFALSSSLLWACNELMKLVLHRVSGVRLGACKRAVYLHQASQESMRCQGARCECW